MVEHYAIIREGGCSCGKIRYRLINDPLIVHCCHCRECQRLSGSAFAINAYIETRNVELKSGITEEVIVPTPSGKGQKVVRCTQCHVAVWSHYLAVRKAMSFSFVRVGTLDDPECLSPDIHIFTASKQLWVSIPDDLPSSKVYYDAKEYWSNNSLKRMEVELNKS